MLRFTTSLLTVATVCSVAPGGVDESTVQQLAAKLNEHPTVKGTVESKSYEVLFDAYLTMSPPPMEVGEAFNLRTIWPGMNNWSAVSDWAESNPGMREAILAAANRNIIGIPYGEEEVSEAYRDHGLMIELAVRGNLKNTRFAYLDAMSTLTAYATAETYRLMESGDLQGGLDLAVAMAIITRQACDRDFVVEKEWGLDQLSGALSNLRDMLWRYQSQFTKEQLYQLAWKEMPYLRPSRGHLLMPEADRIIAESIIEDLFDAFSGEADPEQFRETFTEIQSVDEPLSRFGAARRWTQIAPVHGSRDASLGKLTLVYDDWWRRWRIQAYDPLLERASEFEQVNPIRYAAVLYSVQNVPDLFQVRDILIAEVNGTAMAAGLCAYRNENGRYPRDLKMIYAAFVRKRSDLDPFDEDLSGFGYDRLSTRTAVDIDATRVWLDSGDALMWSVAYDHEDARGLTVDTSGASGDLLLWPPSKSVLREHSNSTP